MDYRIKNLITHETQLFAILNQCGYESFYLSEIKKIKVIL